MAPINHNITQAAFALIFYINGFTYSAPSRLDQSSFTPLFTVKSDSWRATYVTFPWGVINHLHLNWINSRLVNQAVIRFHEPGLKKLQHNFAAHHYVMEALWIRVDKHKRDPQFLGWQRWVKKVVGWNLYRFLGEEEEGQVINLAYLSWQSIQISTLPEEISINYL